MPSRPKKDAKTMSSHEENVYQETHTSESHTTHAAHPSHNEPESLSLNVSKALRKRLELSAREEGVSVEDLASELLAEGLVLRAWEIVERKSAMRGGTSGGQQHQQQQRQGNTRQGHGGGNNKQGHGGGNNKHGGGRMNKRHAAHATSLNLMEDKAAFLEYVRNQERKQR